MKTIDSILRDILNHQLSDILELRDIRIMNSISKMTKQPEFITENQSKIIIDILTKNLEKLLDIEPNLSVYLNNSQWSKPFKRIISFRKISLKPEEIVIEFSYSNELRFKMSEIGELACIFPGTYIAELTEKNVIKIIDILRPYNFEIDESLLSLYDEIKNLNISDVITKFQFECLDTEQVKLVTSDIGDLSDSLLVYDRRLKYQYYLPTVDKVCNLSETIAYRKHTRLYIDSNTHTISEVIESLMELKRLPMLLVFDKDKDNYDILLQMHSVLNSYGITDGIGIYFRTKTKNDRKVNDFISEMKYNGMLDVNTKVAGVDRNYLPKFFLKTTWEPKSIISIGNNLRNSKISIYANRCDLIINYSNEKPLIGMRNIFD